MSPRYCAPQNVIAALKRDGTGWGHDLQCGTFLAPRVVRPSIIKRLKRKMK